jgi:hypothetical protein
MFFMLSQKNPTLTTNHVFLRCNLTLFYNLHQYLSSGNIQFGFHQNTVRFPILSHACYKRWQLHLPWFDHFNYICQGVHFTELLIFILISASDYTISLGSSIFCSTNLSTTLLYVLTLTSDTTLPTCKTKCKIVVMCIVIYIFWGGF